MTRQMVLLRLEGEESNLKEALHEIETFCRACGVEYEVIWEEDR